MARKTHRTTVNRKSEETAADQSICGFITIDQPSSGIPDACQTNPFTLRQADQVRGDLYAIQDDLDFIKVQLARLPTRNEVWRAAMLGMLGGAVAAVTLIEAFSSRSCL